MESNDWTIMRRAVYSAHWRTMKWRGEEIDLRGAPYSDLLPEPVTINLRKEVLAELRAAEESAYEDAQRSWTGRPLHAHVFVVAGRSKSRLVIHTYAEAEDAYYAVASGTFSIRNRACFNAAIRIATALKPYANPETVKRFPISHIEAD